MFVNMIELTLPYPVSVNRYYRTFRGIHVLSKDGRLFKNKVKGDYCNLKPTDANFELKVVIHPKQKKDGSSYMQIIDLDNGLKSILDSLESVIYNDDKQVKRIILEYGESVLKGATSVAISIFNDIKG